MREGYTLEMMLMVVWGNNSLSESMVFDILDRFRLVI